MSVLKNFCKASVLIMSFIIFGCSSSNDTNEVWKEIKYSEIGIETEELEDYYLLFKKDSCPHCPEFEKNFKDIAKSEKVYVVETSKLTDSERKQANEDYELEYVPALYHIKNGEIQNSIVGLTSKEKMEEFIDEK